jgi:hypothetical protein
VLFRSGKAFDADDDERWAVLVAERGAVLPALAAISHFHCRHSSRADVAHAVLTALATITDERRRAIALGDIIRVIAETAADEREAGLLRRARAEEQLRALVEGLGGAAGGVQVIELRASGD